MTIHLPSDLAVRVLLIDDDEDDYLLTRDLIADIPGGGYTLDWASDFDAALDRIGHAEHDVYLIDFRLGAKSGLDLLRAKRERGVPGAVILLTGVGQPEIDREAEEAGAAGYLEKGHLDPVLLERALRYAMRKQAQEEELGRKVAARTRELATANSLLRDADRRKDEFLATLAHELRNPLAPIRNALEIIRLSANNPTVAEKARQIIDRQARHLARLVDDLVDASRISRGSLRVDLAPIDLAEPLRAAIETGKPVLDAGQLVFHDRLPATPLPVSGDPVRLTQLFGNLLSNAARYTEPGGTVSLAVEVSPPQVIVRVTDTGIGIPADVLPRVFDLFAQVDPSTKRSQSGLGIGLALVKRMTELHAGTVTAHSAGVGRGAEFVVTLPLRGDAA